MADDEPGYTPDEILRRLQSLQQRPPAALPETVIPPPAAPEPEKEIEYLPGDILRKTLPREPSDSDTTSGYLAMQSAVPKRVAAGAIGGPIDFFNWANRHTKEAIGFSPSYLSPKPPSASAQLESAFGSDKYKPSDSLEKSVYDAETAALSALVPYSLGRFSTGLGAAARASGAPWLGGKLSGAGDLLTAGGPVTAAATGAGSELLGDIAATKAPKGMEENARTVGQLGGGLVVGGALTGAKSLWNTIRAPMRDQSGRVLVDELSRGAITPLERASVGPNPMFPMTPTVEEVIPSNTGIAALDAYARSTPSGKAIFEQAASNRNNARLGNVNIGTDVGTAVDDPAIALSATHAILSNPSMYETDLQNQARTAAGALPTTAAVDAEANIGTHINRAYNDALDEQINKGADVNNLVTGLATRGRPGKLALDFKNAVEEKDPITRMGNGNFSEKGYEKWMDANKDKLTPAQYDRLKDIRVAKEELNNINAQTAELAKQFPVTPGGSNAGLAAKYFGPGAEGEKGALKYRELTKNLPDPDAAMSDLADFGLAQFRATKGALNPDGSYNAEKLTEFLATHKGWLNEMPADFRAKLTTARDAQQLFDQTAALRTTALKDFENSSAKHLLGMRDPMERMKDILTDGNPVANVREVMGQLRGNPAAQNGLRRNFIDYGAHSQNGFVSTAADGTQTFIPEKFQQFFKQNEDVIKQLYGTPGHDLLKTVNDDITSQMAAEARRARATAGVPERLQEGKLGNLIEKGMTAITGKLGLAGVAGASIGYHLLTGDPVTGYTIAAAAETSSAVSAMVKRAQRQGIVDTTDKLSALLNNPKLAALAMKKAPDDPSHPLYQRLGSTLGSAAYGVATEKATEHKLDETPGVSMGPSGVIPMPGERPRVTQLPIR